MPRQRNTEDSPQFVTNKQLYDELQGVHEKIDRLVTPLRIAIGCLVPANAALLWKVFGSPGAGEVGAAAAHAFLPLGQPQSVAVIPALLHFFA